MDDGGDTNQATTKPPKTGPSWWNPLAKGTLAHWMIFGEGTAITLGVIIGSWLWPLWALRPTDVYWSTTMGISAGYLCILYSNAQSSSVVAMTARTQLADDKMPVRAMVISMIPIIVNLIAIVLNAVATVYIIPNGTDARWMLIQPEEWAFMGMTTLACWGDLRHNATMIGRAQRYRQEVGMEGPGHRGG